MQFYLIIICFVKGNIIVVCRSNIASFTDDAVLLRTSEGQNQSFCDSGEPAVIYVCCSMKDGSMIKYEWVGMVHAIFKIVQFTI